MDPHPDSGLPTLTGYENHGGRTRLGPAARPAGWARTGIGNGDGGTARSSDGVWTGRIWGTYLHGPVLARNPALADLLLSWVVGPPAPLDDRSSDALRAERLLAAPSEASEPLRVGALALRATAGRVGARRRERAAPPPGGPNRP